jgi:hypothetical protein
VTTIVGFILGYVFASKVGPVEMKKTRSAWAAIRKSEVTQSFFGGASLVMGVMLRQGLAAILNDKQGRR